MAIQSNNSEEVVSGGGITLYTGIAPVSVVAVNPSLDELSDLGINLRNEPEYKVTRGLTTLVRLHGVQMSLLMTGGKIQIKQEKLMLVRIL